MEKTKGISLFPFEKNYGPMVNMESVWKKGYKFIAFRAGFGGVEKFDYHVEPNFYQLAREAGNFGMGRVILWTPNYLWGANEQADFFYEMLKKISGPYLAGVGFELDDDIQKPTGEQVEHFYYYFMGRLNEKTGRRTFLYSNQGAVSQYMQPFPKLLADEPYFLAQYTSAEFPKIEHFEEWKFWESRLIDGGPFGIPLRQSVGEVTFNGDYNYFLKYTKFPVLPDYEEPEEPEEPPGLLARIIAWIIEKLLALLGKVK